MLNKKVIKDRNMASTGDIIEFSRKDMKIKAIVLIVRENSAIVEILDKAQVEQLDIENNRTVVSHKNYKIRQSKKSVS